MRRINGLESTIPIMQILRRIKGKWYLIPMKLQSKSVGGEKQRSLLALYPQNRGYNLRRLQGLITKRESLACRRNTYFNLFCTLTYEQKEKYIISLWCLQGNYSTMKKSEICNETEVNSDGSKRRYESVVCGSAGFNSL